MNDLQRDDIGDIYEVAAWGAGYFEIGPRGNLLVRPARGDARSADLKEIVDHLIQQGNEWLIRRHTVSDGHDTDLQFHPDKFEGRLGEQLDSVLDGLLFRDSHESKKDSRRSIRTPRQATGR